MMSIQWMQGVADKCAGCRFGSIKKPGLGSSFFLGYLLAWQHHAFGWHGQDAINQLRVRC
jgi:hypothetical protein